MPQAAAAAAPAAQGQQQPALRPLPAEVGGGGGGAGADAAASDEGRCLCLSVPRVEMRMYRRSRTSADILKQPPHFEYLVRCEWTGQPEAPPADADGADPARRPGPRCWWDELPASYVLRRRWLDIVRFHELLVSEWAYDPAQGCARVKARIPELPSKAELDRFEQSVAATGDTLALSRPNRKNHPGIGKDGDPWDELDVLHTIYVENRLGPYFVELNKVLAEVPKHLLRDSVAFRKFVTNGVSCKIRDTTTFGFHKEKFCGPAPHCLYPGDLAATAATMRRQGTLPPPRPSSSGQLAKPTASPKAPARSEHIASPPPPPRGHIPPASPSAGMSPSASAPVLGEVPFDEPPHAAGSPFAEVTLMPPYSPGGGGRRRRVASSHYGFFAKSLKGGLEFGCSSGRDFWRKMAVKEQAELRRRATLRTAEELDLRDTAPFQRLPALPPAGPGDPFAVSGQLAQSDAGARRQAARRESSFSSSLRGERAMLTKHLQADALMKDIVEGLRVTIIGDRPPSAVRGTARTTGPVFAEERAPATEEETLKVYGVYRRVRDNEIASADGDSAAGAVAAEGLPALSWPAFLAWTEQQEDLASDFRYRSACAALNRALRLWLKNHATQEDRAGVPLTQLFRWIWPSVSCDHVVGMLTWVCLREVAKIRQRTPRVIDTDQRKRLESLFHAMDFDGKGHCTAEDIAGGRNQGLEGKLKNIVDVDTVRAFCGDCRVSIRDFLELMCEDGYRAHEDSAEVVLADGNRLRRQVREVLGVTIWTLKDPPAWEGAQRRLIDAIEAEIKRWRRMAVLEVARSQLLCLGDDDTP